MLRVFQRLGRPSTQLVKTGLAYRAVEAASVLTSQIKTALPLQSLRTIKTDNSLSSSITNKTTALVQKVPHIPINGIPSPNLLSQEEIEHNLKNEQIAKHNKYLDFRYELYLKLTSLKHKISHQYPKDTAQNIIDDLRLDALCDQIHNTPTPEEFMANLDDKTIRLIKAPWGLNKYLLDPLTYERLRKAFVSNTASTLSRDVNTPLPTLMNRLDTTKNEKALLDEDLEKTISGLNALIEQYKKTKQSTHENAAKLFKQYQVDLFSYKLNACRDWNSVKAIFQEHPNLLSFVKSKHWGLGVEFKELSLFTLFHSLEKVGVVRGGWSRYGV